MTFTLVPVCTLPAKKVKIAIALHTIQEKWVSFLLECLPHSWKMRLCLKNGSTFEPYGTWKNINADVDYKLSKQETVNFSTSYSQESTYEYSSFATVKTRDYVEW